MATSSTAPVVVLRARGAAARAPSTKGSRSLVRGRARAARARPAPRPGLGTQELGIFAPTRPGRRRPRRPAAATRRRRVHDLRRVSLPCRPRRRPTRSSRAAGCQRRRDDPRSRRGDRERRRSGQEQYGDAGSCTARSGLEGERRRPRGTGSARHRPRAPSSTSAAAPASWSPWRPAAASRRRRRAQRARRGGEPQARRGHGAWRRRSTRGRARTRTARRRRATLSTSSSTVHEPGSSSPDSDGILAPDGLLFLEVPNFGSAAARRDPSAWTGTAISDHWPALHRPSIGARLLGRHAAPRRNSPVERTAGDDGLRRRGRLVGAPVAAGAPRVRPRAARGTPARPGGPRGRLTTAQAPRRVAPINDVVPRLAACVASQEKLLALRRAGAAPRDGPGSVFAELETDRSIHEADKEALEHSPVRRPRGARAHARGLRAADDGSAPGCDRARRPSEAIAGPVGARGVTGLSSRGEIAGRAAETPASSGRCARPRRRRPRRTLLVLSPWAVRELRCDTEAFTGFHAYAMDLCLRRRAPPGSAL